MQCGYKARVQAQAVSSTVLSVETSLHNCRLKIPPLNVFSFSEFLFVFGFNFYRNFSMQYFGILTNGLSVFAFACLSTVDLYFLSTTLSDISQYKHLNCTPTTATSCYHHCHHHHHHWGLNVFQKSGGN